MTEEELRALNDPWVDWFLSEQKRLHGEMRTDQLVHVAQSFGSPVTEGAARYRAHGTELELLNAQFMIYALAKGYLQVDQLDMTTYDQAPPKGGGR